MNKEKFKELMNFYGEKIDILFNEEQIDKFQLGYLPASHRLHEFLSKKGSKSI